MARLCPICSEGRGVKAHTYTRAPEGERIPVRGRYERVLYRCAGCLHGWMHFGADVEEAVVAAAAWYGEVHYGSVEEAGRVARRIRDLPTAEQENVSRTDWLQFSPGHAPQSVLDVGSGLGIFPQSVADLGVDVVCVERDALLAEHLQAEGLTVVSLEDLSASRSMFPFVSAIHVIEHAKDPISMVRTLACRLVFGGRLFLEVPSMRAYTEGPDRDEFLLDHRHVFSLQSLAKMAQLAGLRITKSEEFHYQVGAKKYVLWAILERGEE